MIRNQILEKRICQLVAITFAVPLEQVLEESKIFGVEKVIEKLENQDQNKPNYKF